MDTMNGQKVPNEWTYNFYVGRQARETVNFIRKQIGQEAALLQLAEECTELAKACIKWVRAQSGINPTRNSLKECGDNFIEELADVINSMTVAVDNLNAYPIKVIAEDKLNRWKESLNDRDKR